LTDRGLVRDGNEDHFVIAQVNKSIEVRQTSLAAGRRRTSLRDGGRLFVRRWPTASADGRKGDLAERTHALGDVVVPRQGLLRAFQGLDATCEEALLEKLEAAVRDVHEGLVDEYGGVTTKLPATTLTLVLLVWPRAYHIQVGDSRAYVRRGGRLQRLTRDQTLGEYMVSLGAWTDEQAAKAPAAANLSSAIGGSELLPVVGLIDLIPGDTLLLCTDGLTKHVSDEQIESTLARADSAVSTCTKLVEDALAGGGTDNVTVLVVRTGDR
jgi:protein phosphatase